MRKQGSGFGLVLTLVVVAVVLYLTAKAWRDVGSEAVTVSGPGVTTTVDDRGTGAGEELRGDGLPDLEAMRNQTQAHSEELREALESSE